MVMMMINNIITLMMVMTIKTMASVQAVEINSVDDDKKNSSMKIISWLRFRVVAEHSSLAAIQGWSITTKKKTACTPAGNNVVYILT